MTQHQWVRLGDVSTLITKGTTPKTLGSAYSNQGIPFLRSEDVVGSSVNWKATKYFIDQTTHELLQRSILRGGDVLVTIAGTIGRVGYVPLDAPEMNCNQAVALIRLKGDLIDYRYAKYALQSPLIADRLFQQRTTATIPNISLAQLGDAEIPLPPLGEQQRIVDILDRAASIQRLRQAADEKLKQIIPALFVDMFGDPASNPKGYTKSALGTLINIRSSVRLPDLANEAEELCIGADAISGGDGKLLFQPTVGSVMPKSGKYFFHDGDVLYSKIRPYLCKAWLADCSGYCSADIYAIECNERLTPHFLKYLLLSKDFTDYAVAQSSRASMPKVNREALSAYEFPLPPVELQREFSALAERVLSLAKLSSEASGSGDLSMASLSSQFFNAA